MIINGLRILSNRLFLRVYNCRAAIVLDSFWQFLPLKSLHFSPQTGLKSVLKNAAFSIIFKGVLYNHPLSKLKSANLTQIALYLQCLKLNTFKGKIIIKQLIQKLLICFNHCAQFFHKHLFVPRRNKSKRFFFSLLIFIDYFNSIK